MSTYLLLRNNQESGPFSFEEVRQMSLKSYDLIWVVGKSAAWRYPGELIEFKSFAPPVPGQPDSASVKSLKTDIAQNTASENSGQKSNNQSRTSMRVSSKSVYVNLPATEKRVSPIPISADMLDSEIDLKEHSQYYNKPDGRPSKAVGFSSKLIWVGTVCLLFGAGILTGFFISDRRKFFSDGAKNTQTEELSNNSVQAIQTSVRTTQVANTNLIHGADSLISIRNTTVATITSQGKKKIRKTKVKQDSATLQLIVTPVLAVDSTILLKSNREELLYKKIKEHPENYVDIVTGKYSTGFFGGVSAVPITLTNNSPVKLDMVVVSVQYIQNNEKIYKTEDLSFFDIEPGESVTERSPKSSRGTKISQHISVINSRQIDLHYTH